MSTKPRIHKTEQILATLNKMEKAVAKLKTEWAFQHNPPQPIKLPKATKITQPKFYKSVGTNIRKARIKKGITQEQLADAMGISRVSIVNIEAGRQKLLLHHILNIAEALGLSWAQIQTQLVPHEPA
jgi:DNA-binding XRE family transcriptional regulator